MIIAELPGYLSRLGGEEYLGLIIALFTLTAGLSRPFSGKLTDRWGRIPVMIIGALVSGIGSLLYPFVSSIFGFFLVRLIHGFSTGFKPTGTSAYVADLVPMNKRGEALGILSMFATIGSASGPVLGSAVYLSYDINTLFYVSAVFAVASVAILLGMKETLEVREKFTWKLLKITRNDIYEPSVLVPSVVMLLTTFSFGTVVALSPDFSDFLGVENKGLFFSFFTGSSLLVRIIGGKISDKYGRRVVLKISTATLFICMLVIGFATTQAQFFTGAFLFGLGYGLNSPTLFAWAIDRTPDASRGKGISTIFIFLEIGIGLGALITGSMYQGVDSRFPLIFGISSIFSLLAFLYITFIAKNE
ncbi:MAG: MFS family permease [Cyclobacteriaceae bacterium]|jgi:MFS family permease